MKDPIQRDIFIKFIDIIAVLQAKRVGYAPLP